MLHTRQVIYDKRILWLAPNEIIAFNDLCEWNHNNNDNGEKKTRKICIN